MSTVPYIDTHSAMNSVVLFFLVIFVGLNVAQCLMELSTFILSA